MRCSSRFFPSRLLVPPAAGFDHRSTGSNCHLASSFPDIQRGTHPVSCPGDTVVSNRLFCVSSRSRRLSGSWLSVTSSRSSSPPRSPRGSPNRVWPIAENALCEDSICAPVSATGKKLRRCVLKAEVSAYQGRGLEAMIGHQHQGNTECKSESGGNEVLESRNFSLVSSIFFQPMKRFLILP